jgi:hypothetical protein
MRPFIVPGVSHTDHLPAAVLDWALCQIDAAGFGIHTLTLPESFPAQPCDLIGPATGLPVPNPEAIVLGYRPGRRYASRLVRVEPVPTREITVIAGPAGDDVPGESPETIILYTAFAGPAAPREPDDPSLPDEEVAAATAFWAEHALVLRPHYELVPSIGTEGCGRSFGEAS